MDENDQPQRDVIIQKLVSKHGFEKDDITAIIDKCIREKGVDGCETAFKIFECYRSNRIVKDRFKSQPASSSDAASSTASSVKLGSTVKSETSSSVLSTTASSIKSADASSKSGDAANIKPIDKPCIKPYDASSTTANPSNVKLVSSPTIPVSNINLGSPLSVLSVTSSSSSSTATPISVPKLIINNAAVNKS